MNKDKEFARQTQAIRSGQEITNHNEHAEALLLTSSFRFDSAEQAAARFANEEPGDVYSRYSNPTVRMFEQRMAKLEQTPTAIATASGMAAIFACVVSLCASGAKIVASQQLFGATLALLQNVVAKFGIEVVLVDQTDPAAWEQAANAKADLFFLETPSNPQLQIYDIEAICAIGHAAGALVVVDNCVCTPYLQQPYKLGADLVMHSGTKYIDGQGRVLGGVICGSEELIYEKILPYLRCGGPSLSPFNAWVLGKGLETLSLRINAMSASASELATQFAKHKKLASLLYPGHASHPDYALAKRQQQSGGALLSLNLVGGKEQAFKFLNALQIFTLTANFGDAKSTATHPATTTHSRLEPAVRSKIGIGDNLVRLSIGLEHLTDLQADIEQALAAV